MSKERLRVLLCGNMVGENEKPLMIRKAAKPICFKNLNINNLPVTWRNNKNDCSDAKMKKENRNVLFLDMLPATQS
jgi:hypothetical protein